jgi:hypothetical protein
MVLGNNGTYLGTSKKNWPEIISTAELWREIYFWLLLIMQCKYKSNETHF